MVEPAMVVVVTFSGPCGRGYLALRIKRFIGKNVNGFLNFDINFNNDLTFVTGINGTGKTTAMNSIVSLLFPRLDYLALEEFDLLSVDIEHNKQDITISSYKEKGNTILDCSQFKVPAVIEVPDYQDDATPQRQQEREDSFFKEQASRRQNKQIMQFFEELPTPMYLGLDRRSVSLDDSRYRYGRVYRGKKKPRRNIFSRSLGQSLIEALFFARENFQNNRFDASYLDAEFRRRLVLELLDLPPISFSDDQGGPSSDELRRFEEARKNLDRLPALLDVEADEIKERLAPMFELLDETVRVLKPLPRQRRRRVNISSNRLTSSVNEGDDDRRWALFSWSVNKSQINKINKISNMISEYNKNYDQIFRKTNEFKEIVNTFLTDSGKFLDFDSFGDLIFRLAEDDIDRDIRSLSSGEIQLVVMMTHLYFNPEVREANVFIIDEPELSLHVHWQEKFVDSLLTAAQKTQFIMATHSPSIILNKISKCVEIPARTR